MNGDRRYRVECATCPWFNASDDERHTRRAGEVHVEILKPGHVLKSEPPKSLPGTTTLRVTESG